MGASTTALASQSELRQTWSTRRLRKDAVHASLRRPIIRAPLLVYHIRRGGLSRNCLLSDHRAAAARPDIRVMTLQLPARKALDARRKKRQISLFFFGFFGLSWMSLNR